VSHHYFSNNDCIPVLLICRSFIQKRPELLQTALNNNHSDLISIFISIDRINLLQQKNQHGETVLLHAVRLNRVTIFKTLIEKKNFVQLLDDVNDK
jgi:ankyrin repeat protein